MQLEFQAVNKYFNDFHVLNDVSFKVQGGQIFGFLGRNGAGKTTTIRILMDVFKANSGKILMDGVEFDPKQIQIGYLPEERGMYAKSKVIDQLIYFSMLRGATRDEAKHSAHHWAKRFDIEEYLPRKLETLSKGNQQKVQITQAFLNNPDLLILDEPFSGLDPVNSRLFQDALLEYTSKDRIIIFSSHQMGYIESFCDSIAIIDEGTIVLEGSLNDIRKARGRDHLRVAVNGKPRNELRDELAALDLGLSEDKQSLIVHYNNDVSKRDILDLLIERNYDISVFSDYEPSLQDIFIQEVGTNDETA